MYKVLVRFKDKNHQVVYEKGDTYPKKGIEVTEERLQELSSGDNLLAQAVIEKVEKDKAKKEDKKTTKQKGK